MKKQLKTIAAGTAGCTCPSTCPVQQQLAALDAKLNAVLSAVGRHSDRILRVLRDENDRPFDKRSPLQRKLISGAVNLYKENEKKPIPWSLSACTLMVWRRHGDTGLFKDAKAFDNAVRYDLTHFYPQ